jgi:hypothetical protein
MQELLIASIAKKDAQIMQLREDEEKAQRDIAGPALSTFLCALLSLLSSLCSSLYFLTSLRSHLCAFTLSLSSHSTNAKTDRDAELEGFPNNAFYQLRRKEEEVG